MKRNKCRACVLSHILALKKLEERKLTPALICEDDLVRTKEDAMRRVPLPALAAVVSVGHNPLVSADAPIAYEGGVAKRHWWPCGKQATNPRRPDIWYLPVQKARSCVRDWRRNFAMGFGHLWTIYYSTLVSLRISRKACTSQSSLYSHRTLVAGLASNHNIRLSNLQLVGWYSMMVLLLLLCR